MSELPQRGLIHQDEVSVAYNRVLSDAERDVVYEHFRSKCALLNESYGELEADAIE